MDLLRQTQELCRLYDIKPARSKGQNFLIKEEIYDQLIAAADLRADDTVLEVGPGFGFLTSRLAKIVKKVIAVELDDKLAEVLQIGLDSQGVGNVEIINQDILKLVISNLKFGNNADKESPNYQLPITNYKVVANLPYNISSVFLRKFLSSENKPDSMVLMLQKEVAERICARPGEMSLLAVSVQFYAEPEIIQSVEANCFWPEPEVESAIIKLKVRNNKPFVIPTPQSAGEESLVDYNKINKGSLVAGASRDDKGEKEFFRLVKIGFSARRKMLKNNLAAGLRLDQKIIAEKIKMAGISENCRPQELSVENWINLSGLFGFNPWKV
jgi:16S rRNA (adenine1518-N6/adenine1519-N6)-dimethyltransferase